MMLDDNLGAHGDALYTKLMETHEGLSPKQSHALNARLILMMMNEIGDPATITNLLKEARKTSSG